MIDEEAVLREFRRRMVAATGIDPETQLAIGNYDFEVSSPTVCEFSYGGDEELATNGRTRIENFILEYDIYVPRNSGEAEARRLAFAVKTEFDPGDDVRRNVSGFGFDGMVKRIRSEADHDERMHRVQLVITADIWQAS